MGMIWTIIIGFIAGVIAKFIMPGDNEPSGFILTAVLGIVARSLRLTWAKLWDGMHPAKGPGWLAASSAQSSCCSFMDWSLVVGAPFDVGPAFSQRAGLLRGETPFG